MRAEKCVRLRSLKHRLWEGFSAGKCNCGLSRHNLDSRVMSVDRGEARNWLEGCCRHLGERSRGPVQG